MRRSPVLVLVNQPPGQRPIVGPAGLRTGLEQALASRTDLEVEALDPELLSDCSGRLACVAGRVSPAATARYLFVLTSIPSGQSDFLFSMLVDLTEARDILASAGPDDKEARLLGAVKARTERTAIRSEADLFAYYLRALDKAFRPALSKAGHWRPFGGVFVDLPEAGFAVSLDGMLVGLTTEPKSAICPLREGAHAIRLEHPRYDVHETYLDVLANEYTTLEPQLDVSTGERLRAGTFYAGLAMTAAGVAATSVAIARGAGEGPESYCAGPGDSCKSGGGFVREGGLLLAPLGYSLAGTGLVWALAPSLSGDSGPAFWLWVAAGVVAGAASYGLSAALNPE